MDISQALKALLKACSLLRAARRRKGTRVKLTQQALVIVQTVNQITPQ